MNTTADEWMCGQTRNSRLDRGCGATGSGWISCREEFERALEILQCASRVNYRRHGLGRGLFCPVANRSSQACTSSARYISPVRSTSASALRASLTKF